MASVGPLLLTLGLVVAWHIAFVHAGCAKYDSTPTVLSLQETSDPIVLNNLKWIYYDASGKAVAHPPNATTCALQLCDDIPAGVVTLRALAVCSDPSSTLADKEPSTSGCFSFQLDLVSNAAVIPREVTLLSLCYPGSDPVASPVHLKFSNQPPTCLQRNVTLLAQASGGPRATFSLSDYDDKATFLLSNLKSVKGTLLECTGNEFNFDGCGQWTVVPTGPDAPLDIQFTKGTLNYTAPSGTYVQGELVETITYNMTDVFGVSCSNKIYFHFFATAEPTIAIIAPNPIPKEVTAPFWVLLSATSPVVSPSGLQWVPSTRQDDGSTCVRLCNGRLPVEVMKQWSATGFDVTKAPLTAVPAGCTRNSPAFIAIDAPPALAATATFTIVAVDPRSCKTDTSFSIGVRATDGVSYNRALIESKVVVPKEDFVCKATEVSVDAGKSVAHVAVADGFLRPVAYGIKDCDGLTVQVEGADSAGTVAIVPRNPSVSSLPLVKSVLVTANTTAPTETCKLTFYATSVCSITIKVQGGATTAPTPVPPTTTTTTTTTAPATTTTAPLATSTTPAAPPTTTTTTTTVAPPPAPTTTQAPGVTTTAAPTTESPPTTTQAPGVVTTTTNAPVDTATPAPPVVPGSPVDEGRVLSFPMIVLIAAFGFAVYYFRNDILHFATRAMGGGGFAPVARRGLNAEDEDEDDSNAPHTSTATTAVPVAQPKPQPKRPRVRRSSDDENTSLHMRSRTPGGGIRSTTPHSGHDSDGGHVRPKPAAKATPAATGWDAPEEEWQ